MNDTPLIELNETKLTPRGSKVTIASIMNEVKLLRQCIESQAKDMREIKAGLAEKPVNKPAEPNFSASPFTTPKQKKNNITFASVFRNAAQQPSAKRKRTEKPTANAPSKVIAPMKFVVPKAKTGTKSTATGLSAAPKREPKPNFTKSVWVGQLDNTTTESDVAAYIKENTLLSSNSQFRVRSLLKKGKDASKMNFVSFKIDVTEEHFDMMMDPDIWPVGSEVRQFKTDTTLGDFFPALKEKTDQKNVTEKVDSMDLTEESPVKEQQQTEPSDQASSQIPSAT